MKTQTIELQPEIPKIKVPPHPVWPHLDEAAKDALKQRIKKLLHDQNAVLVAHYYVDGDLQALAEETGGYVADSLEMARFGSESDAKTLVVCGVRFMGETAKILNPEKRVLMPDLDATCSLDEGCPADLFSDFCDAHPDRTVVVYANTSAAVKARADWMVTSGIALPIVRHLHERGEKIIWAPDKHLGHYIQTKTGADMLLWQGACIVHEAFKADALQKVMELHPDAAVLGHGDTHFCLGDRVHGSREHRQLQVDAPRQACAEADIARQYGGMRRQEQDVIECKGFLHNPHGNGRLRLVGMAANYRDWPDRGKQARPVDPASGRTPESVYACTP